MKPATPIASHFSGILGSLTAAGHAARIHVGYKRRSSFAGDGQAKVPGPRIANSDWSSVIIMQSTLKK